MVRAPYSVPNDAPFGVVLHHWSSKLAACLPMAGLREELPGCSAKATAEGEEKTGCLNSCGTAGLINLPEVYCFLLVFVR